MLEAKSGATLEIKSNVTNVNATTSIIKADDGGIVELVADTITGGTIALNSAGAATALQIEGTVTLSDTTTTTLSNFAQNTIYGTSDEALGVSKLVNKGTISGVGSIGDGTTDLTLDNFGNIAALSSSIELVLNTGTNAITNEAGGVLEAKSGATLEIVSNVTNVNATTSIIKADDGGIVELVADTITGGTIALNSAGAATALQIEGTVTLSDTTTTTLSNFAQNTIYGTSDEALGVSKLVNKGTISGVGSIGDGTTDLTLDNFGNIAALSSSIELVLNTGTNAITNEAGGVLEAKSGATLEIMSNVTNVNATTSIIKADDGGIVELVADTITGGTIALNSAGAATALQIEGTVTLSDTTTTTLSNFAQNTIYGTSDEALGVSKLVNKGTISGVGSIGDGTTDLTLDNFGNIAALSSSIELVLNTGTNAITNEAGGVLEAKSGATLEIVSNVTNVNATTSIIKADDGGIVELVADTITGGTIALNSAGAATALQIEGTVTLSDTTTTTLSNFAQNTIYGTSDEALGVSKLVNKGTISGVGSIGDGTTDLTLDNFGNIAALSSSIELVLNTGTNAITNEAGGVLEAKSGATLEIKSNVTNVNATTSIIKADDGGIVELVADTITGGTIALNSAGAATALQIEGTVTLSDTTTTTLSNFAQNTIYGTSDEALGVSKLVNKGTISGVGSIGDGTTDLTLDNFGNIAALSSSNELVLNTGTNAITNEAGGVLEAKSGATLEIVSNVTNVNATTSIIKADDGGIVELVADTITGGTIALNSAGAATALQIEGTVTLSDTTTTTLSNFAQNTIYGTSDEAFGRLQAGQ